MVSSNEKTESRNGEVGYSPCKKSTGRSMSQRALKMSLSSSCKTWAVGFLFGVCITYVSVAAITSFRSSGFDALYMAWSAVVSGNSSTLGFEKQMNHEEKAHLLHSAWSAILQVPKDQANATLEEMGLKISNVPPAPHLEDCESVASMNEQLDRRGSNGSLPPWMLWKGSLGLEVGRKQMHLEQRLQSDGAYPPWVDGSDEDNFPLTRKVQRDLWIHQHPVNCNDPNLRFLVTDWETLARLGLGAQFASMAGFLAIAINEQRILVTNYFNRADHDGCQGSSRSSWSCYYLSETSAECRARALELMKSPKALKSGTVTTYKKYNIRQIWDPKVPSVWGDPWNYMQPTTDIDGELVTSHRKMDLRWWKAQTIRYLMRFQSQHTCNLMNAARHESFGLQAANMVARTLPPQWPEVSVNRSKLGAEKFVWSNLKPWIPRPLLSVHVRMGDKAQEMKIVGFENYMQLAERTRQRFPELNNIWLSTEMQDVVDKSGSYPNWNFYYSNVSRQVGNTSMAAYTASLGRQVSTEVPLVNFIMASEADFFIGALGSTWCYFIDGMRNTGGKVMAGYLSVNRDRYW